MKIPFYWTSNRISPWAAIVVAAFIGMNTATTANHGVPLKLRGDVIITSFEDHGDGTFSISASDFGKGWGTLFGRYSSAYEWTAHLEDRGAEGIFLVGEGLITQVNADGSLVLWHNTFEQSVVPASSVSIGRSEIIEGTGRFANAEGFVEDVSISNDDQTGFSYRGEGIIHSFGGNVK